MRELLPLVVILHRDPTSWLFAVMNKWEYPTSREALTLADMTDVLIQANTKRGSRPKPYPRPFSSSKRYGGRAKNKRRTMTELRAVFAADPEEG